MKKALIMFIAAALFVCCAVGCNIGDKNDPAIDPQTLKPATSEPSPSGDDTAPTPDITEAPATDAPSEVPTEEPTEVITPEPTEVPTPRPETDSLKFKNYLDKENGAFGNCAIFPTTRIRDIRRTCWQIFLTATTGRTGQYLTTTLTSRSILISAFLYILTASITGGTL